MKHERIPKARRPALAHDPCEHGLHPDDYCDDCWRIDLYKAEGEYGEIEEKYRSEASGVLVKVASWSFAVFVVLVACAGRMYLQ